MASGDNFNGPQTNGWRFEKRISFDTIIAAAFLVVGIGGPAFLAWSVMDKRVTVSETLIKQIVEQQATRDGDAREERTAAATRAERTTTAMQAMQIDIARLLTIQAQARR